MISIMGNQGTFTKNFKQILTDAELLYHTTYVAFCILGLCMHPFFYSVLVSTHRGIRSTIMRRITTFGSMTDRIYNSGPIQL
jgi:hypothetical protein